MAEHTRDRHRGGIYRRPRGFVRLCLNRRAVALAARLFLLVPAAVFLTGPSSIAEPSVVSPPHAVADLMPEFLVDEPGPFTQESGWRFEPLGPEGAEIAQICSLGESRWAARCPDGSLLVWKSSREGFGEGAWERLPLPLEQEPVRVRLIGPLPGGRLAVLVSSGLLFVWGPDAGNETEEAGAKSEPEARAARDSDHLSPLEAWRDLSLGSLRDPQAGCLPGAAADSVSATETERTMRELGFRLLGEVTPRSARGAVALLPAPKDPRAVLLLTRRGIVHEIGVAHEAGTVHETGVAHEAGTVHETGVAYRGSWMPEFRESPGGLFEDPMISYGPPDLRGTAAPEDPEVLPGDAHDLLPEGALGFGGRAGFVIRSAFVDCSDPSTVFVLTEWEGAFVSTDGARTFLPIAGGLPKDIDALVASAGDPAVLYAASADGLYRSDDLHSTWTQVGVACPGPSPSRKIVELAVRPSHDDVLCAVTRDGCLLRSSDGGFTWQDPLAGLPVLVRSIACDCGEILLGTSRGVLLSQDAGRSWRWRNTGLRRVSVLAIAAPAGDANSLILGTDLGLYASNDGGRNWRPSAKGGPAIRGAGSILSADPQIGSEGLLAFTEERGSEAARGRVSGCICALAVSQVGDGQQLLCAGGDDGVSVCGWLPISHESRYVWTTLSPERCVTSVAVLPDGEVWAAGVEARAIWVGRADARGDWVTLPVVGSWGVSAATGLLPRLAVVPDGKSDRALFLLVGGLLRHTAVGWEMVPTPAGGDPVCVAAAPGGVWLGTEAGLYRGTVRGEWTPAGLDGERVVEIVPARGASRVFARTSDGIYWSQDDGWSWEEVPLPPGLRVMSMAADPSGKRLFLGTARYGLFAVDLPEPEVLVGRPLAVDAFPNPFNETVLLRCRLSSLVVGAERPRESSAEGENSGVSKHDATFCEEVGGWGPSAPDGPGVTDGSDAGDDPAATGSLGLAGAVTGTENIEICIFTVHGQLVRRLRGGTHAWDGSGQGSLEWAWDGRTEQGLAAPSGMYLVSTTLGAQKYVGKIIKLR